MTDKKTDVSEGAIQALREAIYAAKTSSLADCVVVIHPLYDLPPDPGFLFALGVTKDRDSLLLTVGMAAVGEMLKKSKKSMEECGTTPRLVERLETCFKKLDELSDALDELSAEVKVTVCPTHGYSYNTPKTDNDEILN